MKKETWKTIIQIVVSILSAALTALGTTSIIQIVVSILSAALTALGTTSCMGHGPIAI